MRITARLAVGLGALLLFLSTVLAAAGATPGIDGECHSERWNGDYWKYEYPSGVETNVPGAVTFDPATGVWSSGLSVFRIVEKGATVSVVFEPPVNPVPIDERTSHVTFCFEEEPSTTTTTTSTTTTSTTTSTTVPPTTTTSSTTVPPTTTTTEPPTTTTVTTVPPSTTSTTDPPTTSTTSSTTQPPTTVTTSTSVPPTTVTTDPPPPTTTPPPELPRTGIPARTVAIIGLAALVAGGLLAVAAARIEEL